MTETSVHPRRALRSIAAILAGFVATVVLSLGTDQLLHSLEVYPPWGEPMSNALLLLATAYRSVYAVAGSYIAARLAPSRPMRHALVLGAVGLVVSTAGTVATWNAGPAFEPKWYPLSLIAIAMPCAWAGGMLRSWQLRGGGDG